MRTLSTSRSRDEEGGSWYSFAVLLGCVVVLLGLLFVPAVAPALLRAEHWAADWRTAFLSGRLPTTHPDLAIVSVTEQSLEPFPYILPINRGYLADLVAAIEEAGARAIALDFFFVRDTEEEPDRKLKQALAKAKDKVILGVFEQLRRKAQLDYQYDFISSIGAPAGFIDLLPDPDHVIRYRTAARPGTRHRESLSALMSGPFGWTGTPPERIAWLLPPHDGKPTFLKIEAHRLLAASPEERSGLLGGRVVIVGGELFTLDRHWTPLSLRTGTGMRGVEVHAQMAAELIDGNRSYSELGPDRARLFLASLAVLGIVLGLRFRSRRLDFLDWRVVSLAVIGLDLVLFRYWHIILPFTLAAVAWVCGVTAGTQFRNALVWSRARWGGTRRVAK
jgi:CHASE2 domain-containing sensor protein